MKKNNLVAACVYLSACLTFSSVVSAAEGNMKFAFSDQQMQALGIETMALQRTSPQVAPRVPAQVIVPPDKEHVASAPLAGMVAQLFVQQNQTVKKGAPLVRMVSTELGQVQLQAILAFSKEKLARQTAQRETALFNDGIIPERRVYEAQAALKDSEASFHQAKAALRLAGFSAMAIHQLLASGKPEESLTLRAVAAGVVTSIDVKPGQRVDANSALLHLVESGVLWLDIQVPATDANNWKAGTKVTIPGRTESARITSIASDVSASTQSVSLHAVLDKGKSNPTVPTTTPLRAGEFITVEVPATTAQEGWDVPLSAVAYNNNQAYVFVRQPNGFEARLVSVVASAGQRVNVKGKLTGADKIAVSGIVALKGAWLKDEGGE